jgi:hypothetical protein
MEPNAASKTVSGIPDASSPISRTFSLWTPASASGVSGFDVRKETKLSSGAAARWIDSDLMSKSCSSSGGRRLNSAFVSAARASKSCFDVGAVATVFCGKRVRAKQTMQSARPVVFPTPWPDRTEMRRSPFWTAVSISHCFSSGSKLSTSLTSATQSWA